MGRMEERRWCRFGTDEVSVQHEVALQSGSGHWRGVLWRRLCIKNHSVWLLAGVWERLKVTAPSRNSTISRLGIHRRLLFQHADMIKR